MYAQIGDIILDNTYGFATLSTEKSVAIAQLARIDVKPKIQATGQELDKFTFSISLNRLFHDPEKEIARFEKYINNYTPVRITLGNGNFLGNYLLTSIKNDIEQTTADGNLFACTISIDALEYTGRVVTEEARANTGLESSSSTRVTRVPVTVPVSGEIAMSYNDANALSNGITNDLESANNQPVKVKQKSADALLKVQQADKKLVGIYIATANVFRLINEAGDLRERVIRARKDLGDMKSFLSINDVNSAMTANRSFQKNMGNVGNATAPFTKNYILRRSV